MDSSPGLAADAAFGTGHLNLRGRTPNGHRFVMNPRQFWLIDASTAHMSGHNIGPPGPLEEPATLEDMRIPQRGLFAVLRLRLARPRRGQATPTRHGKPCSPIVGHLGTLTPRRMDLDHYDASGRQGTCGSPCTVWSLIRSKPTCRRFPTASAWHRGRRCPRTRSEFADECCHAAAIATRRGLEANGGC